MSVPASWILEPKVTVPHHGGTSHGSNGTINYVIIHDEEAPLSSSSAENIANYFARTDVDHGCAQYVIDANSEQHCVADDELSRNAPPNSGTIGIERDGYASWSAAQWSQPNAVLTTARVAARCAALLVRYALPIQFVDAAGQRAGVRGWTTHRERTWAYGQSTHTDPGPNFDVQAFGDLVAVAATWLQSVAAVKDLQAKLGLAVDGQAGSITVGALGNAIYGGLPARGIPTPPPAPVATLSAPPAVLLPTLREGATGRAVLVLQRVLRVRDDGVFGAGTKRAVVAFQRNNRLPADGIVGHDTWRVLTGALR